MIGCDRVGGRGHRTPGGQWGPFGELQDNTLGMVSNILTGHASIREPTGRGEGSFVETQHLLPLVVLFMSIGGALPRSPPNSQSEPMVAVKPGGFIDGNLPGFMGW